MSKETKADVLQKQWKAIRANYPEAYDGLIDYIELQKKVYNIMATGPIEVYRDVPTFDGKTDLQLDFEPEKYAYLLQRSVGCDIVKMYVEEFANS